MAARSSSSRWRTALVSLLAVVLVLSVAVVAVATYLVRRPLPDHSGEQQVPGLTAEVEVLRDERGVPHLYAETDEDLMAGLGFVHAQDRFFEMDYRRHVTSGRLSELVGDVPAAVEADMVIRTMGWREVAEEEWELLTEESRALYTAYADGVNAYLDGREASRLGLEYTVLSLSTDVEDIDPWTGVDSLAWLKAMAWDLRGNYNDEVARAGALRPMFGDVEVVDGLFPAYPAEEHAPILPEGGDGGGESASAAPAPGDGESPSGEPGESPSGDSEAPTEETDADAAPDAQAVPGAEAGTEVDTGPGAAPIPGAGPLGGAVTDPIAGTASSLTSHRAGDAVSSAGSALDAVPVLLGEGDGIGSNSFVVAGEHTATGEPILANDPHLGLEQPNLWYQVGLHCVELDADCTFDVTGFSFAGMPGVIIGHNDQLSWGLTNLGADVMDLTLERVFSDGTYLRGEERLALERRTETILVDGGDPVTLEVLSTEAGPIVSEVLGDTRAAAGVPVPEDSPEAHFEGYSVALQWTALTPGRTGDAVFALNRAATAEDVAAAAELFEVPSQNIVFATADGDIGYQAPGRIPVRGEVPDAELPADGSWPRPGWDERYAWQGFVAPEDMPAALNPAEGFVVAANQAVLPPGTEPFLTGDYDAGYRSQRIRTLLEERLAAGEPLTVDGANEIMLDDASPFGEVVVPYLLEVDVEDPFVAEAVALLEDWAEQGYPNDVDSAGAAYFNAVWVEILAMTLGDELPDAQAPNGGDRWLLVLEQMLAEPSDRHWDDRTTVNVVETRDEILGQALVEGRHQLTARLGKDPSTWRWGDLHVFAPQHPVLGGDGVPGLVRRYVNPEPVGVPGGSAVVNATSYSTSARDEYGRPSYAVTAGPSMRMVVDMADLDASTWVTTSGTSGHPASAHYTDQAEAWAEGETFPWAFSRAAVEEAEDDRFVLTPGG
ncbi:penicillin acylase family protein [Georgenia sp. Z1344]|uniref:penicillin acylase family protein n=1 Tax=Georgenia sp. Z1344 TaxID=3416706 RepID=UPI003CF6C0E7